MKRSVLKALSNEKLKVLKWCKSWARNHPWLQLQLSFANAFVLQALLKLLLLLVKLLLPFVRLQLLLSLLLLLLLLLWLLFLVMLLQLLWLQLLGLLLMLRLYLHCLQRQEASAGKRSGAFASQPRQFSFTSPTPAFAC
jgi:hypothetical protein